MEVPAVDNDWACRWRISCRGLGNKRETRQCVSWDAVVRPVSVVILIDNPLRDTLLTTHQTAVPLSTQKQPQDLLHQEFSQDH